MRRVVLLAAWATSVVGCNAILGNEERALDDEPTFTMPEGGRADAGVGPGDDAATSDALVADAGGDASAPCGALDVASGRYAEAPDVAVLDLTTLPVTVEAWVWRKGPPILSFILGHGTYQAPTSGWDLSLSEDPTSSSTNKTILVSRTFASSTQFSAYGPAPSAATGWTHVAAVRTASETRLYVNGARVNGADPAQNADPFPGVLRIGASALSGATYPFVGLLDEIRISSSARYAVATIAPLPRRFAKDAETIALWHFDVGAETKDSAGTHDLTLAGGATVVPVACDAYGAP